MDPRPINFLEQQTEVIKPKKPRWLIFLFIFGLLFLGGCLAHTFWKTTLPNDPTAYDPITLEPKKPVGFFQKIKYLLSGESQLTGQSQDRINVLLLGMGGAGHDGPYLTDTNMIVSIKPSTGQIAMISVPRDLAVEIPGQGIRKINYVNAFGEAEKSGSGGEFTRNIFSNLFALDIPYYVRLDFKAFSEIIDAVGGITVNVERDFTDHMYPAANEDYQTVSFAKGVQNMDGETALKFARSRHGSNGEGSDFARAKRQQKILLALKEKVLSFSTLSNPIKIAGIISSLENHLDTNLEFSDIINFLKLIKGANLNQITNLVFDDSETGHLKDAYGTDGAFLLEPKTGNFAEINNLIANVFIPDKSQLTAKLDDTPTQTGIPKISSTTAKVNVEIQNGTWNAGLAARMKKRLEDRGFTITTIGNTETRPQDYSGIFNLSNNDYQSLELSLSTELHIPIKQQLPPGVNATTGTEIFVLLGEDSKE